MLDPAGGLKDVATPFGSPITDKLTLPPKPFAGVTVIALVPPELPGTIVTALGIADKVKAAITVRLIVVVCATVPEVPNIVMEVVPGAAVPPTVNDTVAVLVAGLGVKDAMTPLGNADVAQLTWPLNPLDGVMVIVLAPVVPPWRVDRLLGDAETVKFGDDAAGQLLTRLAALRVPSPDAKSHPVVAAKAGL